MSKYSMRVISPVTVKKTDDSPTADTMKREQSYETVTTLLRNTETIPLMPVYMFGKQRG